MGLRGPSPKPTGVRVLEGCRAHRPLPENEPQYPPGVPVKPKTMSRPAKLVWDELVTEMAPANVLRSVDQRALWQLSEDEALLSEAYAGLWKTTKALEQKAKKEGKELPGGALFALVSMTSGRLAMNAIRDLAARVLIERREFGLTPSSRTRISASTDSPMDSLEMKLCG
ncbi:MAG: P27 family phage terminase small subunit [Bryobacteraceae bacterium]|jgi:phage terminase small subunit